jgi:hypothetical protein
MAPFKGDLRVCISREELSDSLRRPLTSQQKRVLLMHLLKGCETCCEALWRCSQPDSHEPLTAEQDVAYETALDRAADLAKRADALSTKDREQFSKALPLLSLGRGISALTQAADVDIEA